MEALKDQSAVAVTEIQNSNINNACSHAVTSAVEVFTVANGQATISADLCPREVLRDTLSRISAEFKLDVAPELDLVASESLHRILQAVFATHTQDSLEQDSSDIFARRTPAEKARILAQAIGAACVIFSRLAHTGRTITWGLLNREAQLFAESDQRTRMQAMLRESLVFDECEGKEQISELITDAMAAKDLPVLPQPVRVDDNMYQLLSTSPNGRPKIMGTPGGLTVMSLN